MSQLYPFLTIPIFDERPWGVRDLRPIYTKLIKEPIGESWLTWEDNRVANGPLAGQSLGELAKNFGPQLIGQLACYPDRFPLLVKFLFPGDKLSVQVHPDDELARRSGHPCGKTECWYVVRAEPGARVALGLRRGVTLEEFREAIAANNAEALLNWVGVFAGDMIYVAAGTVHTIGGGMVLVETQQTSDITYRLYDYGRPRELHIEDGLAVTKLLSNAGKVVRAGDDSNLLIRSPYFQVEKMALREPLQAAVSPDSPHILVAVSGAGVVEAQGMEPVGFASGEAIVVPACVGEYTVRPQWDLELMRMSLPAGPVAEPETVLPQSVSTE